MVWVYDVIAVGGGGGGHKSLLLELVRVDMLVNLAQSLGNVAFISTIILILYRLPLVVVVLVELLY